MPTAKGANMLYATAVVMLTLWSFALISTYPTGEAVHVLLVLALAMILFNKVKRWTA
jgi:hypothetical protein